MSILGLGRFLEGASLDLIFVDGILGIHVHNLRSTSHRAMDDPKCHLLDRSDRQVHNFESIMQASMSTTSRASLLLGFLGASNECSETCIRSGGKLFVRRLRHDLGKDIISIRSAGR